MMVAVANDLPQSPLADLRGTPLADLAEANPGAVDQVIRRVLPESPVTPVPVAAFQSAI